MKKAICAVVKNEQACVLEWIIYHTLLGFDAVLLLDDQSTDMTRIVAERAAEVYDVRVSSFHEQGEYRQRRAYERVCRVHQDEFAWIAFLDLDEYLVPRQGATLSHLLASHAGHAGLVLPWLMFGSAHHEQKPHGLVIEDYTLRSEFGFSPNRHAKSIVRPRAVRGGVNPHVFELDGSYGLPDGTPPAWELPGLLLSYPADPSWLVHHYFTRSRAHWRDRMRRGQLGPLPRTWDNFTAYDRNDVADLTLTRSAEAVRTEIKRFTAVLEQSSRAA